MIDTFDLFLSLEEKGLLLLLDIIPTLEEKSSIFNSQILTLVDLDTLIPLPHGSLLFFLKFI